MSKIIVGIPAKNEEKTIGKVIKKVKDFTDWIYVFDDGSTDQTKLVAVKSGVCVISNPMNLGKGATMRFAIRYFLDNKILKPNDTLIFVDADGQCDVKYILLFNNIIQHGWDMAVLKRDLKDYPLYKKIGNWFMNEFGTIFSGAKILDAESGYRAFSYNLALDILKYSSSKKYGIETEINIICGKRGHKIFYVFPSERTKYIKGKGTKIQHGIMNVLSGLNCWFKLTFFERE